MKPKTIEHITYFRLTLTLASPLSIGASESASTDRDVVLDAREKPMIPATAIAGVYRSLCSKADQDKYFGCIAPPKKKDEKNPQDAISSELLFYDAKLNSKAPMHKTVRDSVALDENKYAKKGAKFDFEVVETGAEFIGFVEARSKAAADFFRTLLGKKVSFGAKSTRGYGQVALKVEVIEFDFAENRDVQLAAWLGFDMFDSTAWVEEIPRKSEDSGTETTITLQLRQKGGLSIRQYYTNPGGADSGQLTLRDETPVIPGTSWAGMFRHHMATLLECKSDDKKVSDVFGFVSKNEKSSAKSKIRFSESKLVGATEKQLTRNAIDRFTGGTKQGALFTEITVYGGTTNLEISFDNSMSGDAKFALFAALMDLHHGYAAVGGLTSIGRGLFEITAVGEDDISDEGTLEEKLKEVICFEKGQA